MRRDTTSPSPYPVLSPSTPLFAHSPRTHFFSVMFQFYSQQTQMILLVLQSSAIANLSWRRHISQVFTSHGVKCSRRYGPNEGCIARTCAVGFISLTHTQSYSYCLCRNPLILHRRVSGFFIGLVDKRRPISLKIFKLIWISFLKHSL
jgi:hypothetical protein